MVIKTEGETVGNIKGKFEFRQSIYLKLKIGGKKDEFFAIIRFWKTINRKINAFSVIGYILSFDKILSNRKAVIFIIIFGRS